MDSGRLSTPRRLLPAIRRRADPRYFVHPSPHSFELLVPELDVAGRGGGFRTVGVSMPIAAMNEKHGFPFGEHNVRRAWQFPCVQTILESPAVKGSTQGDLRPGIPATDARHHPGTHFGCHYVRHGTPFFARRVCPGAYHALEDKRIIL